MQKFRILPKIVIRFVTAEGKAGPTNPAKGQAKSERPVVSTPQCSVSRLFICIGGLKIQMAWNRAGDSREVPIEANSNWNRRIL